MRFSLIYGPEAMVLIEIIIPPARLALASKVSDSPDRIDDMKANEEKTQDTKNMCSTY